jgi:hypothetical protein
MTFAEVRCCKRPTPVHVVSLRADGTPKVGFGGGERTVDVGGGGDVVAVLALPRNRIAVVVSKYGEGGAFALVFRPNGSLDPRFGRHGILSFGKAFDSIEAAVVDSKGRITIIGKTPRVKQPTSTRRASLLTLQRFNGNGRVDRTFDGGSPVRLRRLRDPNPKVSVLQPNGRLLVLASRGYCSRSCSPFHAMLVRYLAGSAKARCLGRRATIIGTRGQDVLVGTRRRDVIVGLGGSDKIRGRGGNDLICGGGGKDSVVGGLGRDRVHQ